MTISPMLSCMRDIRNDATQTAALINLAEKNQLSPQDPIWGVLGELAELKTFLAKMPDRVDELKDAADKEAEGLRAEIRQLESEKARKPKISPKGNYSAARLLCLPLITGGLAGVTLSGLVSYFYLIPKEVGEQRIADRSTLEYLNTSEGKNFIQLVKLNRGYFPDKCQEDAKKQGVFLKIKDKKTERVCVLLIP